jgi:LysM repeat protein
MAKRAMRWAQLGLGLALAACVELGPAPGAISTATLLPWRTTTRTSAPTRVQPSQEATIEPGPSPTPLTHIVQAKETLLTIAAQYGVTLDALLLLNPDVHPNLLSIGQPLLIPGPEGEPITSLVPTATAIPLTFSSVTCSPTATGGLTCLTAVRNPTKVVLEGLSARIDLLDGQGEIVASAVAFAPLNLLPPGEVMPLGVYFEPPAPAASSAVAAGLTAFPANETETRYLEVSLEKGGEVHSAQGSTWTVDGQLRISPDAAGPASRVLVLVVGFGGQDEVVGYAVWESAKAPGPGEAVAFDITVLSLGAPIERVSLLAEALAVPAS